MTWKTYLGILLVGVDLHSVINNKMKIKQRERKPLFPYMEYMFAKLTAKTINLSCLKHKQEKKMILEGFSYL